MAVTYYVALPFIRTEDGCALETALLTPRRHARPKIAVVHHGLAAPILPVSIYCFDHRDLLAKIDRAPGNAPPLV
jgi:hypothetical protein